jgi:hypothetical protein
VMQIVRSAAMRVPAGRLACAVTVVVSLLAGIAHGDSVTVRDQRNVRSNPLDIRSASAGHRGDALTHEIRTWKRWRSRVLESRSSKPRIVCVYVWRAKKASSRKPDYQICATYRKGKLRGYVYEAASKHRLSARVTVRRLDRRSVSFTFGPELIGDPRSYRWQAVTGFTGKGCPRDPPYRYGCDDSAPTGKTMLHTLTRTA